MESTPETLTFSHRFNRGVTCTIRVTVAPPPKGSSHILGFEWTGKPTAELMPEYRKWILRTNQILADRWQYRILYAFGPEPNRHYERLSALPTRSLIPARLGNSSRRLPGSATIALTRTGSTGRRCSNKALTRPCRRGI